MKWRQKKHPKREAGISDVELIGHDKVRITVCYNTTTEQYDTHHIESFDLSLCDTKYLGYMIQGIATKLQAKLDEFKKAISGG